MIFYRVFLRIDQDAVTKKHQGQRKKQERKFY